jgi:hypothetical protein
MTSRLVSKKREKIRERQRQRAIEIERQSKSKREAYTQAYFSALGAFS